MGNKTLLYIGAGILSIDWCLSLRLRYLLSVIGSTSAQGEQDMVLIWDRLLRDWRETFLRGESG